MRAISVVHVSTARGWYGGEEQARLLVRGLQDRGHRSLIFARAHEAFARRMQADGYEVVPIPGNGRHPRSALQMRRQLRAWRPDVLHCHDAHALTAAGLSAWGLSIPARVVSRKVEFPIRGPWRYRWLVDRVIAVSRQVAGVCRDSGIPADKIRVVHDGVDPQRIRSGARQRGRQSLSLPEGKPLLLCVAALTEQKGQGFLLAALPKVLAQRPGVCLALAGDGPARNEFEAQARRLQIDRAVRFLGYRHDVPDLLHAADMFIMPSLAEGMCTSLVDAMLARLPIVTTACGGIADVVGPLGEDDAKVARIVPPQDAEALADAILGALADQASSAATLDRAESRAQHLFTSERMVEETLGVYRELLGD